MRAYPFLLRVSSFTGRAVVFFFLCTLLLFFFYLIGNLQEFMDDTQLFLVSLLNVSLILQLVSSVYLAGFIVMRTIRERRLFVLRFVLLVVSAVFSLSLLVAIRFLQSWLRT